jgi:simple sugar transport system permease protein/ribose transport system permease protein
MREHKGVLYLCGIFNNRMGTYRLPKSNRSFCGVESYWGPAQ